MITVLISSQFPQGVHYIFRAGQISVFKRGTQWNRRVDCSQPLNRGVEMPKSLFGDDSGKFTGDSPVFSRFVEDEEFAGFFDGLE